MKKLMSKALTLIVVGGMISSTASYGAGRGSVAAMNRQGARPAMTKSQKMKTKVNNRKEVMAAKKLEQTTVKLAEVAGNPDATESQIDKAAEAVAEAKAEAEGFFANYVGEWTPTKIALAGAISTAVIVGAVAGAEHIVGKTSYVMDSLRYIQGGISSAASTVGTTVSEWTPQSVKNFGAGVVAAPGKAWKATTGFFRSAPTTAIVEQ